METGETDTVYTSIPRLPNGSLIHEVECGMSFMVCLVVSKGEESLEGEEVVGSFSIEWLDEQIKEDVPNLSLFLALQEVMERAMLEAGETQDVTVTVIRAGNNLFDTFATALSWVSGAIGLGNVTCKREEHGVKVFIGDKEVLVFGCKVL